ncbi:MAG: hypothetical protein KDE19_12745, partial [Caldilineaceae bacterium]|nr:hypothetical protein [Caldilineaceae bacterium]
ATNLPPFPERLLLLSSSTGGKVNGIAFADEDILAQNLETHIWKMYFDGSDVGITDDVDAFGVLPDGTLLLSLGNRVQVPGLGIVDDSDIIRFHPVSLGSHTSGTFSWYVDASDVGLTTGGEDIDAIHVTADGLLIVSTLGNMEAKGVIGKDEDLLAFHAVRLGSNTVGEWSVYFDGSDVKLTTANEDIWGLWRDGQTHNLYMTTAGAFRVDGLSGSGADIFIFQPLTLGVKTTGTFQPFWNGAAYGFGNANIDDLEIITRLPLPDDVTGAENESFTPEIDDEMGDDVPDDLREETFEEQEYQIFLPLLQH